MNTVRLEVAAREVVLRLPAGADDLLLLEAGRPSLRVALSLLSRLVEGVDGSPLDCTALPIPDIDGLLLRLRQKVVGDLLRADTACTAPACGARFDFAFSIGDYIAHHAPVAGAELAPGTDRGWYRLLDADVELRVPCAGDQLAVEGHPDPVRALLERCARPLAHAEAALGRIEAALERLAPSLFDELETTCPECGSAISLEFDPLRFILSELRDRAAWVYEDVAWIAHYFHWNEAEILALPTARRMRYAELAAERARWGAR